MPARLEASARASISRVRLVAGNSRSRRDEGEREVSESSGPRRGVNNPLFRIPGSSLMRATTSHATVLLPGARWRRLRLQRLIQPSTRSSHAREPERRALGSAIPDPSGWKSFKCAASVRHLLRLLNGKAAFFRADRLVARIEVLQQSSADDESNVGICDDGFSASCPGTGRRIARRILPADGRLPDHRASGEIRAQVLPG
jgi:hypothetical protein